MQGKRMSTPCFHLMPTVDNQGTLTSLPFAVCWTTQVTKRYSYHNYQWGLSKDVWFQEKSILPHGWLLERGGRESLRLFFFFDIMKLNWNFQRSGVGGVSKQRKLPWVGRRRGIWIFPGNTSIWDCKSGNIVFRVPNGRKCTGQLYLGPWSRSLIWRENQRN